MRAVYIGISESYRSLMFMNRLLEVILKHVFWQSTMDPWRVFTIAGALHRILFFFQWNIGSWKKELIGKNLKGLMWRMIKI